MLWSIDPRDYRVESAAEILRNIRHHRYCGGGIILLHDTHGHTVSGVENLLEEMGRRGLDAVTVSELLGNAPAPAAESVATT